VIHQHTQSIYGIGPLDVAVPLICFTRFIKIYTSLKSHNRCQEFHSNKLQIISQTPKYSRLAFPVFASTMKNANTFDWTNHTQLAAICVSSNGGTIIPLKRDAGKGRSNFN
jgi:hypothetical protein